VSCRKGPGHKVDEVQNTLGPSRCAGPCECDGDRACSEFGWCTGAGAPTAGSGPRGGGGGGGDNSSGIAATAACKKGPGYNLDEARNKLGPNRCAGLCECSGTRVCSVSGWCIDAPAAAPAPAPAPVFAPAPAPATTGGSRGGNGGGGDSSGGIGPSLAAVLQARYSSDRRTWWTSPDYGRIRTL
jgi:hypothetical protein